MTSLQRIAVYDLVPVVTKKLKKTPLLYVAKGYVSMFTTPNNYKYIKAGTVVTENVDKAFMVLGRIFIIVPGTPKGINTEGKMAVLSISEILAKEV